jgi:hypothetical protein
MSKVLTLKLKDEIFEAVEKVLKKEGIPRNRYINNAIDYYNKLNRRRILKTQYLTEAELVQDSSLEVLEEFEQFEENIPE